MLVYRESIRFSLHNDDLSECHIAMSKLFEFYSQAGIFQDIVLIVLFRFYYANDISVGMSQVSHFIHNVLPNQQRDCAEVWSSLELLRSVVNLNYFKFKKLCQQFASDNLISILLGKINENIRRRLALNCCKAYPLTSVKWIQQLFGINDDLKTGLESLGLDADRFTIDGEKIRFKKTAPIKSSS